MDDGATHARAMNHGTDGNMFLAMLIESQVHLSVVPTDSQTIKSAVNGLSKDKFFKTQDEESVHSSVYGSRFASQDLPKNEMPETEMPREVAYRMIKYV